MWSREIMTAARMVWGCRRLILMSAIVAGWVLFCLFVPLDWVRWVID